MIGCSSARTAITGVFLSGIASATIAPYQTVLALGTFGLTPEVYSLVLIFSSMVSISAAIFVGIVTDRFPPLRRALLSGAAAVGAVGYGLLFIFQTPAVFVAASAFLLPIAATVTGQSFAILRAFIKTIPAGDRHFPQAVARAAMSLAWTLVPLITALLLWFGTSVLSLTLISCSSYLLYLIASARRHVSNSSMDRNGAELSRPPRSSAVNPSTVVSIASASILDATLKLYGLAFPLLIIEKYGGTIKLLGLASGALAVAEIPLIFAWSVALRRLEPRYILAIASLVEAVHLLVVPTIASPLLYACWLIGHVIGASAIMSISIGYLQDAVDERPGLGSSFISVVGFIGSSLAAALFGLLQSPFGAVGVATAAGALAIIGAGVISIDWKAKFPSRSFR